MTFAKSASMRVNSRTVIAVTIRGCARMESQEKLLGAVSSALEANGFKKEWVRISTAGFIQTGWSKQDITFTLSLEEMLKGGAVLPDVSDLYVD